LGGLNGASNRRNIGYYVEAGSTFYIDSLIGNGNCDYDWKKDALDNLEEILSVKEVDMIQFGPGDYSLSIGYPGQRSNAEVREAEIKIIKQHWLKE